MFVVTGASGNHGRLTIQHLRERVDAAKIVAVTRDPAAVADLGVTVRQGDFTDPGGLVNAFDGAERVLLVSVNSVPSHTNAIDAAIKACVGSVLYTSVLRAGDPANPNALVSDHRDTERILASKDIPFTILRYGMWSEMLPLTLPLQEALDTGVLRTNAGDESYVSYVTRSDCAAVAAVALAAGGFAGQFLNVTGPEPINHPRIAKALTEATGRPIRHERCSDEEARNSLLARLPAEIAAVPHAVDAGLQLTQDIENGWFDITTRTVERLTGRPATTLTEFLRTL
ncbi:NAD(P)H-binding protein [Kibdelosporangium philippinense]|uniref:NAD(P)H-binding protein n=1 Tax=Kibdelosporangium philippinense TaxID=211113 RepID=A0ABS8Z1G4_9PSEU|nr:NAD(P)H-binding protein [Kibdelosporangium philippinense]MCE7001778.1 NAD(P)H-binding protein [Kibdelosporangium philippinense]